MIVIVDDKYKFLKYLTTLPSRSTDSYKLASKFKIVEGETCLLHLHVCTKQRMLYCSYYYYQGLPWRKRGISLLYLTTTSVRFKCCRCGKTIKSTITLIEIIDLSILCAVSFEIFEFQVAIYFIM